MKKLLIGSIIVASFFIGWKIGEKVFTPVGGIGAPSAGTFITKQGGTGTSSPSGILYGDGSAELKTVLIGSNLTFSSGTLAATGGGSGGGTFSTTTSQVAGQNINYSNETDDIVAIGSNATTSAEFWFDPNTNTANFGTGGAGDSSAVFGPSTLNQWILGYDETDKSFAIASSTALGTNNVFTITRSGNVGIGTTSPYAKLSVVGQTVAEYFTATSTTATSTFYGPVQIGGTSSDNLFHIDCDSRNWPVSTSVGGCTNWTLDGSTGDGVVIWDGRGAEASGKGFSIRSTDTAHDTQLFSITHVGVNLALNVDCDGTTTTANCGSLTSDSSTETAFGIAGAPDGHATLKVQANRAGDVDTALYSASAVEEATYVGQAYFARINSNKLLNLGYVDTGEWVTLTQTGLGIGTSSPYAPLSVVGEVVARNFTATSTSFVSQLQQVMALGSTTLQNFTGVHATTTSLAVRNLNASNCDVKSTTDGSLYCGTDATGAGGGAYPFTPFDIDSTIYSATTSPIYIQNDAGLVISDIAQTATTTISGLGINFNYSDGAFVAAGTEGNYPLGIFGTPLNLFSNETDNGVSLDTLALSDNRTVAFPDWSGTFAIATSTLDAPAFLATSTTATSTFNGGLIVDGTTLVVDHALSRVGIGTLTPTNELHVSGSIRASGAIRLDTGGTGIVNNTSENNAKLEFRTGGMFGSRNIADGNPVLTLQQTNASSNGDILTLRNSNGTTTVFTQLGNLGLGSSTPAFKLSVSGDLYVDNRVIASNIVATSSLYVAGGGVKGFVTMVAPYSTTTWSGTTTIYMAPAVAAGTFTEARCETNTGTVFVSLYDGTNRANLFQASTTIGTFGFTSNNTFTANESIRVDIGTPASSPRQVACRFTYKYD